jgi:hypothetical protein
MDARQPSRPAAGVCTLPAMLRAATALLVAAALALLVAATASAALPKPRHTKKIDVPKSIAGVELKMKIEDADKEWGRKGDCDLKGFSACTYEARNPRSGSASIEAARRGNVSSIGIFAGRSKNDRWVFQGKLLRIEAKRGIGLGARGGKVPKAYPEAIRTANRTGYIVEGKGRSYMTFQTLDGRHITGITLVDGRHQG